MGLRSYIKRRQFDLDRYTGATKARLFKEIMKRHVLPTMPAPIVTLPKEERFTTMEGPGIAAGDLVYVTGGKYKGKISKVIQYNKEADTLLLNEATMSVVVPKNYWTENQNSHVIDYPVPIPRKNVRLAAKERDEQGKVSYVVAEDVVLREKYYDANHKKWLARRYIKHHESIEVPWPAPMSQPKDDAYSTLTEHVFTKTHELQTVAKAPFPKSILGELRNPYSSFKKKALNESQARRLNAPEMPLSVEQRIYLAKKAQTPVKKLQPLSEEAKDLIGSKIAEHLAKIDNPLLFTHLEAVSAKTTPEFERVVGEIEKQKQLEKAAKENNAE